MCPSPLFQHRIETMKQMVAGFGVILLAMAAGAQVASHAPTVASQANPPAADNKPVVRVNGSILTESDLMREELTIFPYARQHGGIPKDLEPQIRDGALKMIVFEELVYQKALRDHWTVQPPKLRAAETAFRKQFATPEEFQQVLAQQFNGSNKLLQQKIQRSLLIDEFLQKEVEEKSAVSLAEARAYYDRHADEFQRPETYTFQTISMLPPQNANAGQLKEERTRAEHALEQARTTKSAEAFGLLAEKISEDDYRVMMGQHKPIPVDQLAPQVVTALRAMKPGDVSGLIQVDQIYTIVRLQAHTPAGKNSFIDVKQQLQKKLEQSKQETLRTQLDRTLHQNARIQAM